MPVHSEQMPRERARDIRPVFWYIGFIFVGWSVYVDTLYTFVQRSGPVLEPLLNECVRAAIFGLPAVLLLRVGGDRQPATTLGLRTNVGRGVLWGVIAGGLLLATHAGVLLLLRGDLHPQPIPAQAFFTSLGVATLVEEIAFRGYLLQQLRGRIGFWAADMCSAALFAGIHLPGWLLVSRLPVGPHLLAPLGEIFALGLALGFLLRRTGSLWACFIFHAANNLAYILFYSA